MRDTPKAGMVQIIDYIMIDLQVQKEVVVVVTVYEGRMMCKQDCTRQYPQAEQRAQHAHWTILNKNHSAN